MELQVLWLGKQFVSGMNNSVAEKVFMCFQATMLTTQLVTIATCGWDSAKCKHIGSVYITVQTVSFECRGKSRNSVLRGQFVIHSLIPSLFLLPFFHFTLPFSFPVHWLPIPRPFFVFKLPPSLPQPWSFPPISPPSISAVQQPSFPPAKKDAHPRHPTGHSVSVPPLQFCLTY